ncbi:MAG: sigma-54 dependent transcriptional regulator [Chlamydiota bacterium]
MKKILIVDDEESIRTSLSILLKKDGYSVSEAADANEALGMLDASCYDLVITDLNMPEMGGIDLLRHVKKEHPDAEVIILTAYGSIQSAVEAIKIGGCDYLTKPIESKDILIRVGNALERSFLRQEVRRLKDAVGDRFSSKHIIGTSRAIAALLDTVDQVAKTDSTALLIGESGTGKELVARALHGGSSRRERAFIPINCGALPETLLESELFGHAKGAFTGAMHSKKGLFEEADGGTIFLDEISATAPMTQVRLLRVLQEQEVRRLGSNETVKINVRVIAATNQDFGALVRAGKIREDLYHRLNVITIMLPSLRDRREDIPLLIEHFVKAYTGGDRARARSMSDDAFEALSRYDWPGNVRELKNAVERAMVMSKTSVIELADLPQEIRSVAGKAVRARGGAGGLKDVERDYVLERLTLHDWNYSKTARDLRIARNTLLKKVREYRLSRPPGR